MPPIECGLNHRLLLALAPVAPMKHLALIVALVALSTSAFAQGQFADPPELRLVRGINVWVSDDVEDGCLRNPNSLEVEAELILRRSNISILKPTQMMTGFNLIISLLGYEITYGEGPSGICVVSMDIVLYRFASVPEGHSVMAHSFSRGSLFTGAKSAMQDRLRSYVSEHVSDLANRILKAQGK